MDIYYFLSIVATLLVVGYAACRYMIKRRAYYSADNNWDRHLYDVVNGGHYSKLKDKNIFFLPELLLCHSYTYVLNPGEALFIPANYWHWIKSDPATIAINYFYTNKPKFIHEDTPHLINDLNIISFDEFMKRSQDGIFEIWDSLEGTISREKCSIESFLNSGRNNKYILSAKVYPNGKFNRKTFGEDWHEDLAKCLDADTANFWIASGQHDTGLHYDEYHSLLFVVSGRKEITLYAPSSSRYLHPMPLQPQWYVKKVDYKIEPLLYNKHKLSSARLPQSQLLYEVFRHIADNVNVVIVDKIYKALGSQKIVWGVHKASTGGYSFEFFFYHLNEEKNDTEFNHVAWNISEELAAYLGKVEKKNLIVNSFTMFPNNSRNNTMQAYYSDCYNSTLPHLQTGRTYHNNNFVPDGVKYINDSKSFSIREAQSKTNCNFKRFYFSKLIKEHPCENIIYLKKKHYVEIQFCGIAKQTFLSFLVDQKFSENLITRWKEKQDEYQVSIDIGFKVDGSGNVVGSSFYGVL